MNLQKNIMVEKISSEELLKIRSDIKLLYKLGFLLKLSWLVILLRNRMPAIYS